MAKVRIINGKGDWTADPPTGADDHDLQSHGDDFVASPGVVEPERGNALVEELGTPGMGVQVAPGIIYVANSSWSINSDEPQYYIVVRPDIETPVAISSNPSGSTRYDLICQQIDKVTPPNDNADNICDIVVVEGTPGSGIPDLPADHEALAVIEVASGATAITDGEISDARNRVYTKPHLANPGIVTATSSTSITLDVDFGRYNKFYIEYTHTGTVSFANIPFGLPVFVWIKQGSGGSHVPTFGSVISDDGDALEFSTVAGDVDGYAFTALPSGDISAARIATRQS